MKIKWVLVVSALALTCMSVRAENNVTMEGTLVSSACYLGSPQHPTTNEMGGQKECGTFCLRRGDPAGLVTANNEFHVLIVPSLKLAPYVGSKVRVTGTDHNGNILVLKAEISDGKAWKEIALNRGRAKQD